MTPVYNVRAAAGAAREVRGDARMATPRRRMRLVHADGTTEVVEPGRDRWAPDAPLVRQHPDAFRLVWSQFHPRGREALRLERELARVEQAMRTAPSATPKPNPTPTATTTPTPVFGPVGGHRVGHIRRRRRTTTTPSWRI